MHPRVEELAAEETHKLDADPLDLRHFEEKVFSQNGEDGILREIFRRIGTTNRFFVECGIQDGSENNTRALLERDGWSGVWIEESGDYAAAARRAFASLPVRIIEKHITAENIGTILTAAGVPPEPDLLSIDIDGNDYWVWKELRSCSPRVVVIEYNAARIPGDSWVMPYDPKHVWDGTSRFGASLDALAGLASGLGYVLVGCDSRGVNAFFVRRDIIGDRFSHAGGGAAYHYVSPKYNDHRFGHPENREQLLEDQVAGLQRQLAGVQEWIREKERVTSEQIASLESHLRAKERELEALQKRVSSL
ncbi:MAG: hypothetical protein ACXV7D_03615 [Thermoanaerobaculia bacterium]